MRPRSPIQTDRGADRVVGASSSCCTACENPGGSGACFSLMGVDACTHNCSAAVAAAGLMAASEAGHEGLHPGRSALPSLRCAAAGSSMAGPGTVHLAASQSSRDVPGKQKYFSAACV